MVKGRVDTTVSSVLQALRDLGKHPNEFNSMIVYTGKKTEKFPCHLFLKGDGVGEVIGKLREKGLCTDVFQSD